MSARERHLIVGGLLLAAALVTIWLVWPYIVSAGVLYVCWRVIRRDLPGYRRRPKSSWSSLGRTAALMFAAWNSRWLKPTLHKASVPGRAGAEHAPATVDEPGAAGLVDQGVPF
jgi:hypothetical protein